jgi:hypothetical protein
LAASLIAFPHMVHLVFSKNCNCPQSLFPQRTISSFPQASHFSLPANDCPLQKGHVTDIVLPQPAHTALPRATVLRQFGH